MIVAGPDFRLPPTLGNGSLQSQAQLLTLLGVIFAILKFDDTKPTIDLGLVPSATYTLTSWYRTEAQNRAAGGVANSLHVQGLAIDVDVDYEGFFLEALVGLRSRAYLGIGRAWASLGRGFDAVPEDDHVHLELDVRKLA